MDFSEIIGDTTTPDEKVPDEGCSDSQECLNYPLASSLPNFPGHFLLTKTVVVRMDAFLVAVVLPFGRTVDFRKLAEHLSARRRSTRLATPEECAIVLGQTVGEIAPFCYRHPSLVRVIVDRSVTLDKRFTDNEGPSTTLTVFTGCAISSCAILLSPAELKQLTGASELDCARFDEAAPEAAPVSYPIHAQDLTPAIEMRFIVDRMLARLGAWLRMLGCDVEILQPGEELPEMQNLMNAHYALIAHALATDRVLLSRDRNLFSTACKLWLNFCVFASIHPSRCQILLWCAYSLPDCREARIAKPVDHRKQGGQPAGRSVDAVWPEVFRRQSADEMLEMQPSRISIFVEGRGGRARQSARATD